MRTILLAAILGLPTISRGGALLQLASSAGPANAAPAPAIKIPPAAPARTAEALDEAATLAFGRGYSSDQTFLPDDGKVREIADVLARVRAAYPKLAYIKLRTLPYELSLGVDAAVAATGGVYAEVDTKLNSIKVTYDKARDMRKIAEKFEGLPGLQYAERPLYLSMGGTHQPRVAIEKYGGDWRVILLYKSAELNAEYWFFSDDGKRAVQVGHFKFENGVQAGSVPWELSDPLK